MWVSGKAHPFADELDLGLVAPRGRGRHVDGPCATALHRCLPSAGRSGHTGQCGGDISCSHDHNCESQVKSLRPVPEYLSTVLVPLKLLGF
jgi:hypothetical protein